MNEIINDSIQIWEECIKTSFVDELTSGIINTKRFIKYLIEDTLYLKEYARCFAYAMTKSETLEEMRVFYSVLSFVNDSETSNRQKYLLNNGYKDEDIEKMIPSVENQDYINHMLKYAKNGNNKEILMAILPCMLSYYYIFSKVLINKPNMLETKYGDLLKDYVSNDYKESCLFWIDYTNKLCQNITSEEKEHLINIFRKSSEHELAFWNMSYDI